MKLFNVNRKISALLLAMLALIALAANSILCRLALEAGEIDPAGFTAIRLLSGAAILTMLLYFFRLKTPASSSLRHGSWLAALMLFGYAIAFSYAYLFLDAGVGALILFGATQISIILLSHIGGTRLHIAEWVGVIVAFAGLVYLVLPGMSAPPLAGFVLMAAAGIAWGIYTLNGRKSSNPLADTGWNFIRTIPFVAVLLAVTFNQVSLSQKGITLAVISGAITSGLGYVLWYAVVHKITSTHAAVVQLLIPVIAAIGGILFLDERLSWRLVFSSLLILGGILLVVWGRNYIAGRFSK